MDANININSRKIKFVRNFVGLLEDDEESYCTS